MNKNKKIKNFINYNIHPDDDPRYYDRNYSHHIRDNIFSLKKNLKKEDNAVINKSKMVILLKEGLLVNSFIKNKHNNILGSNIFRRNLFPHKSNIQSNMILPLDIRNTIKRLKQTTESNTLLNRYNSSSSKPTSTTATINNDTSSRLESVIRKKLDYARNAHVYSNDNQMKSRLPTWTNV